MYHIIYSLFNTVIKLSFMGCLIVAFICLIKKINKNFIGIKFQYAIWFILIFRLLLPFSISSELSIYNYVPDYESTVMNIPKAIYNAYEINEHNSDVPSEKQHKSPDYLTSAENTLPIIWLCGVLIVGFSIVISNIVFLSRMKKYPFIKEPDVLNLFEECKEQIKIFKNISLVKSSGGIKTPCVVGAIRPKIIIPKRILEECDLEHLKYIFLHELVHVKRKDIFVNYLAGYLCIIHWFNPFIWHGFKCMREDREICCDSIALSCIRDEEVKKYGFAIIKLAEISSRAPWLPSMAGIINNKSKLERRIKMIKSFKKNSYRLSALAVLGLVAVGGTFLTGAKATTDTTVTNNKLSEPIVDKIDYPFTNDEDVIGKWESVDFVKEINDFNPSVKSWNGDLYLKSLTVLPDGKMAQPAAEGQVSDEKTPVDYLTWTKGYIIHHNDKTAGQYTIKEINGSKYMFWEWKSGDYSLRGMKPYYYVLKAVK